MRFALFAFAATALAADVKVIWRHEKPTGKSSLTLESADRTVLAETCGNSLGALDFSRLDEHGVGDFSVGSKTFEATSIPQDSGVSCHRIYSGTIAIVECTGVDVAVPVGVARSADCFTHEHAKESFRRLKSRSVDIMNATEHIEPIAEPPSSDDAPWFLSRIFPRQNRCPPGTDTYPADNPDPHQNYLHKQLSQTIGCGAAVGCSVDQSNTDSFSIGFSAEIVPFKGKWTKGSFSVQKSWQTGNAYRCEGQRGETVCIWYNTAHTAYTVYDVKTDITCAGTLGKTYVMKSPNEGNRGVIDDHYCVIGTCRKKGDQYWDNTGPAGGPP
ncbi:hypothetical protein HBI56_209680 [Parastagonospora nodorum]|uniref:Uncharacterized protein n=1 Tax=Phaeosphaeria nodorum (strain SN15 / ATCC MYA-4574 / FGSC 10173) TaxID=321614 RepID=A0A7U2F9H1_PHANO|nr:hypothetical protein HBH56_219120 [Parastagonospora nodorum]QRD01157.1 hypothetical protein JI435_157980 [Parastagonospora nodorum SN15]KAH3921983.1 hypothetical protein HBH54_229240 [Parastagonospora nodorum]KAH3958619.1 hypothetical protein HBH51_206390 [Parastagonospora nodorum]KAH3961224.1 hypothetical protein HBH52_233050 [Parastagonospora nodorum]